MSNTSKHVADVAQAIKAHQPLPEFDTQYQLPQAYALQHQVTQLRSPAGRGGIKLGVTTQAAQAYFGIDHPLVGSLYEDARLGPESSIPYLEGRNLETEFAILVDKEGQPKAIAPAIEIVYVSFSRKKDMSASSLVLCNLGADLFVVGDFLPWNAPHQDVTGVLSRNGDAVNSASMNDALEGPARALPWVWTEIQRRGYKPDGETLIMMGACGSVVPAEKGDYRADYGEMGALGFSIQ